MESSLEVSVLNYSFLSSSSSKGRSSRNHFFCFFLSADFHELWHSMMIVCSLKLSGNGLC